MTETKTCDKKTVLVGSAIDQYKQIVGIPSTPGSLEEVLDDESLRIKMNTGCPLNCYWGTAPTGIPTIGYFLPMKKIADMMCAHWNVTILFADLHAFLDSSKSSLEVVKSRTKVYEEVIKGLLEALGVDHSNIRFVTGSSFQLTPKYQMDLLRLGNITTIRNAQKAGTEVVKQSTNPLVTSLMYPIMQALDEEYLNVDVTIGGSDQRKIFTLAADILPKIGYKKRIHLMNPIIPALSTVPTSGEKVKMSSSDKTGKISVLDSPVDIQNKIKKIYCREGDIVDNTLLCLVRELLFPILNDLQKHFVVNRPEKYGGVIEYKDYKSLEQDFVDKKILPVDLKIGVTDLLISLTKPVRDKFNNEEMQELLRLAYAE